MKIQYLVNVAKLEFGIGELFVPLQYFNTLTKNIVLNFFPDLCYLLGNAIEKVELALCVVKYCQH